MDTSLFDYYLPKELIAKEPCPEREKARLLVLNQDGSIEHRYFYDIRQFIKKGDALVLNNTRVLPYRLIGKKKSGGEIDLLLIKKIDTKDDKEEWQVLAKGGVRNVEEVDFCEELHGSIQKENGVLKIRFLKKSEDDTLNILRRIGKMPLPPYIKRKPSESDKEYYQTVYAKINGSLASPTAGLHFSEKLLRDIKENGTELLYTTLHISSGTFRLIKAERIEDFSLDAEYGELEEEVAKSINECKKNNGIVKAFKGLTSLFIKPGFKFNVIDAMITNFHLPRSSLFVLVCAFGGIERIKRAYEVAIKEKYRFLSYGDAMLIMGKNDKPLPDNPNYK